jgi:hypothetical protein
MFIRCSFCAAIVHRATAAMMFADGSVLPKKYLFLSPKIWKPKI